MTQGRKRILATGLFPTWDVHFIPELELVEKHLAAGDEVTVLTCDAELGSCTPNSSHDLAFCRRCISMRETGLRLLSRGVKTLPLVRKHPIAKRFLRRKFRNIDDLRKYRLGRFDIGMAVLSSLMDVTKDIEPDLLQYRQLFNTMLDDSLDIYLTCRSYLKRKRFALAYIFNGRFSTARALVRACEAMNVEYYTHERGGQRFLYGLYRNSMPHQPAHYAERIRATWDRETDLAFREREAREFFEERRRGECSIWIPYVANQKAGQLPEDWDRNRRNVVIFASSEGELTGIQDFVDPRIYLNQLEGVLHLASVAEADPRIKLYLRVHPNSAKERRQWWNDTRILRCSNLTVIQPKDPVSTYAIMDECDATFTFGSTMGMEATYSGKPSVLLGEAFYRNLNAVYEPANRKEVEDCLLRNLEPKPSQSALPFGFYSRCAGEKLRYSKPWDAWRMVFKGHSLDPNETVPENLTD